MIYSLTFPRVAGSTGTKSRGTVRDASGRGNTHRGTLAGPTTTGPPRMCTRQRGRVRPSSTVTRPETPRLLQSCTMKHLEGPMQTLLRDIARASGST